MQMQFDQCELYSEKSGKKHKYLFIMQRNKGALMHIISLLEPYTPAATGPFLSQCPA